MTQSRHEQDRPEVKVPSPITAEQAQLLQFQKQLHEQGQERFRSIEATLVKQNEVQTTHAELLTQIIANTSCLPEMNKRVDKIERTHNGLKKAAKIVGGVGTSSGLLEAIKWWATRH